MALSSPPRFLDLLKEVLESEEIKDKASHTEFRHYPSSASFKKPNGEVVGACLRQLYWRVKQEPESDHRSFSKRLTAMFGNSIHGSILKRLQKSDKIRIIPESSGRIQIDPLTQEISFRLDGLANYKGDEGGLEIKTMQSYGLQRMVKEGGPKPSHLLQCINYFATNDRILWFSLIYFGRDNGFMAEYHINKRDGKLLLKGVFPETREEEIPFNFDGIISRWKELEDYVVAGNLPPRDFKAVLDKEGKLKESRTKNHVEYKTDWTCLYCDYRSKCWGLVDAPQSAYKIPGD